MGYRLYADNHFIIIESIVNPVKTLLVRISCHHNLDHSTLVLYMVAMGKLLWES